jgi:hypothetical protein
MELANWDWGFGFFICQKKYFYMAVPILIYVKPHVKQFLIKEYGKEPIYTRADSNLGRLFMLSIVQKDFKTVNDFELDEVSVDDLDKQLHQQDFKDNLDYVKCKFAVGFRINRGKITHENLLRLSLALECEFKKAMHYYCMGRMQLNQTELDSIKWFLRDFKISDDSMKVETIIKQKQREREKRELLKLS